MAIEIITKPKIKKLAWSKIALIFLSGLFLVFSLSYFLLIFYQLKLKGEIEELEKGLVRSSAEEKLEKDLLIIQKRIKDWKSIFSNYSLAGPVFEFLEKNTHPGIWFSDFKLNLEEGTLDLKGQTANFEALAQQLLIFKKQEVVKEVNLSKVSIESKEKGIGFEFHLSLDPKIFRSFLPQK